MLPRDREASTKYTAPRVEFSLSDFDILRRLGDGSFSEVVHARHRATGQEYALKMVDKHLILRYKMVQRIKLERDILDKCNFAGIAKLYFTFQDPANLYLALELVPNGELLDQIQQKGQLEVTTAAFYAAEVVLILEYLRQQQVIHRDLKPENLLLDQCGHLKLVDFGSAKALCIEDNAAGQEDTVPGAQRATSLVGTADYVSPEMLGAGQAVTYAADLWSLGCVIFQMLSGRPPFRAASEYLTFQRIANCEYTMPDQLPAAAKDVISKLLVLDPNLRIGAGKAGLEQLKEHCFFKDINWQQLLWSCQAPAFSTPDCKSGNDEGLDWELSSLAAALPVRYSS